MNINVLKNLFLVVAVLIISILFVLPVTAQDNDKVIGKITVTGNEKTDSRVILAEILLNEGDTYTNDLPGEIQKRVMNMRFFLWVRVTTSDAGNQVDITIEVKERMTWGAYPIISLTSDSNNNTYGFEVSEYNLMGQGNKIAGTFQNQDNYNGFSLDFYDSHFKYTRWTFGAGFSYSTDTVEWYNGSTLLAENDVDLYSLYLGTGYWVNYETKVSASLSYRDANYTDTSSTQSVVPFHGKTIKLSFTAQYYDVDYYLDAQYGPNVYLTFVEGYEDPKQSGADSNTFSKAIISGTYYVNPYYDHTMSMKLNFGRSWNEPWQEAFSLGGNGSVRGYQSGSIGGNIYYQTSIDYRIPVAKPKFWNYTSTLTVLGFVDAGYAWYSNQPKDLGDTIMSVGLGTRLYIHQLQTGTMAFDFAYGIDSKDTEFYMTFGSIF